MVISLARVYRNGRRYETGLKREMAYMIVHSFYHLLGYDHLNDEDKKIMRKKEEELLKILDIDQEILYEKKQENKKRKKETY